MKKIILLLSLFLLSACGGIGDEDSGKLQVTTTVGMLADVIENIGGEAVEVQSLMGPGVDPHLYKASAGDIPKLEDADIVFYVGLHLEANLAEVLESLPDSRVVAVGDNVDHGRLYEVEAGVYDPHVWFDVDLWSGVVEPVMENLIELDPENEEFYRANTEAYLTELRDLDQWVRGRAAELSEEQKVLVTAHDAFGYFGRAYGFEVLGIQGISTASDYGLKDLEQLIDIIVEEKVKAIFVESSVNKKSIEALQAGVQEKGWDVQIGGELFSDAMGQQGTEEGTYQGMIKHNVNTIVDALK